MRGLVVGRVRLFFSFKFQKKFYPCALVQWFSHIGDEADEDTGMWIVKPDPTLSVVHLDTILRAAHLIGVLPCLRNTINAKNPFLLTVS
jgi:hypothetical protein